MWRMSNRVPAGWYDDPQMAGTRRYWDGESWTGHVNEAPTGQTSPGFWTLSRAVALGILIAVACVVVLYSALHTNDGLKCETENAQRALDGRPSIACG